MPRSSVHVTGTAQAPASVQTWMSAGRPFAAAITIDAAVLAREPSSPETSASAFALMPNLQYDRGGWRVGVSGTF
jgi:hypothetical protein